MIILPNYRIKLEQAQYHFNNIKIKIESSLFKDFGFELCSFIDAARNITFAMQKESSENKDFCDWYTKKQEEMKNNDIFKFFNRKRISITHCGDPGPDAFTFYIELATTIPPNETVRINFPRGIISNSDEIKAETLSGKEVELKVKKLVTPVFRELKNRHVIEVCQEYLTKLQDLIEECEMILKKRE